MRISEAFELYRSDFIVSKNQSPKTEENHLIAMRSLIKHTGDINIEELSREKIRSWRIALAHRRKSVTVRSYVIKLRVVLEYLLNEGYDVVDPRKIPVPQRDDPNPHFITADQVSTFIAACTKGHKISRARNRAIIALLYSSGIRVSELCALDKAHIAGKNFFTIRSKGGVAAPSFIDHRSQVYIMTYLRMRNDDNPALFLSEAGKRIRPLNIQESFCALSRVTGIKATPHTLRHSFATNLLRNGADIRHAQRLLKHKSIQTTETYLHVMDNELMSLHKMYHSV